MKCKSCGGALEGVMTVCPYCQVRQDVDLRQINFRDLGCNPGMPCPSCKTPLGVIELQFEAPVTLEHCPSCRGMFLNPGELEHVLHSATTPVVWLDLPLLHHLEGEVQGPRRTGYRKCPVCADVMNQLNFAGRSGVIVDRCHRHGVWLDGGELRQLMEWWRAGGRFVHQQHEASKAKALVVPPQPIVRAGTIESQVPDSGQSIFWPLLGAVAQMIADYHGPQ